MKIYTKILLITLPLIIFPALLVGFISYFSYRNALDAMVPDVLESRLVHAVETCQENQDLLLAQGLDKIHTNVILAQEDAKATITDIRLGEVGYVFVVDHDGIVQLHPDTHLVGLDVSSEPWFSSFSVENDELLRYIWNSESRLALFSYFEPWDWYVISSGSVRELTGPVSQLGLYIFLLLALSLIVATAILLFLARLITRPILGLISGVEQVQQQNFSTNLPVVTQDEIGMLAKSFNRMIEQIRSLLAGLEQRVSERTVDLERRSNYFEAASEVSRAASGILDLDHLIEQVVTLIREGFDLYYVGLFMVDETEEWAVLQAGTGSAGRAMLARKHRIKVGEGMIGWTVAHAQARIALEAEKDAVRLTSFELPETRSEAALALRSRGRVLGALSVQSAQSQAFNQDVIIILQTMADQIAIAIDNARLLEQSQQALEAERLAYGELSRKSWSKLLQTRGEWGYRFVNGKVLPTQEGWAPDMEKAYNTGRHVLSRGENGLLLVIPVKDRDTTIGVLSFQKSNTDETWTDEEVSFLELLAEQLSVALESARSYHDTQIRAARDRLSGEITASIRESLDMDTILQTTVREISEVMGLKKVQVRMVHESNDE